MMLSRPPETEPIVRQVQDSDHDRWNEFVSEHPEGNLYQTLVWRDVINDVFGHEPIYLLSEVADHITAILPLFLVKAPWLGSKLISIPYDIGSGGALARDDKSEQVLVERAIALARERRVNYLQLRYSNPREALKNLPLDKSEPVIVSAMSLTDLESTWAGVEKDHRRAVKMAKKRGVNVREAQDLSDYRRFYQVYVRVFRDFGTPPYGFRYFKVVWERLHAAGHVRLLLAEVNEECVGGLLFYCWGEQLVSKFAVCLPAAVSLRAYAALYWRSIELALEGGSRQLSWGTSSRGQSGLIEFKERWGSQSHPVAVYSLPLRSKVPDVESYYDSKGILRRTWRHVPLRLTSLVGGPINTWFC